MAFVDGYVDSPNGSIELRTIVTDGDDRTEGSLAGHDRARTRTMRAMNSNEVVHRVLLVVDERHKDPSGVCQEFHLASMITAWKKTDTIRVMLFCCVEPRSGWRRLLLQSPATVRSRVAEEMLSHLEKLKKRIQKFFEAASLFKASVEIHLDTESATAQTSLVNLLKGFQPHILLTAEHKDQASLQRYVKYTSQENFLHCCAAQSITVVLCRTYYDPFADKKIVPKEIHPYEELQYELLKVPPMAIVSAPRIVLACVNTDSMWGNLPSAVVAGGAHCRVGDGMVVFSSYPTPDAAASAYSTDTEWYDRIRTQMEATKDAVQRVEERAKKWYPGVRVSSEITDEKFLDGVQKVAKKYSPAALFVGSGNSDNYKGWNWTSTVWGHNIDRVARAVPDCTIVIAAGSPKSPR